ncbi:glycoside hydrolase family 32 protein [Lactiplantibacillus pentosus]|uniref:glycoside hydrolase family 32 protein n=2 Tax=Lactiplantibacillus pentosus TaxID=1589 RepID=UPI0038574AEA
MRTKMENTKVMTVNNDRYRLGYHIMGPAGWINDPNGFCYFKGYYHMFYQFYPYSAEWGPMHWGHARSKDLVNWENLPIALTPGDPEDRNGCFSGSAIVKDDTLYLIYTGHHYYDGDDNPDHFWQNQNLAFSTDGIHFEKYAHNPIIAAAPDDNTQHFRDPKVWQRNGQYYLVLGSQSSDKLGRTLLYRSKDLKKWNYLGPIASARPEANEGYMWECPDLFTLADQQVLLASPQGIKADGHRFLNLHETGYFVGRLDYDRPSLADRSNFTELDHGHDFYASQTTLAPDGRRIVMGWMAMWESNMPEQADGWAGALTIPRELTLKSGHLWMRPARELKALRTATMLDQVMHLEQPVTLRPKHRQAEINMTVDLTTTSAAVIQLQLKTNQELVTLTYDQANNQLVLKRGDRPDKRYAHLTQLSAELQLNVFMDTSSLEIFVNDGDAVFTERFYSETQPHFEITGNQVIQGHVTLYDLKNHTVVF